MCNRFNTLSGSVSLVKRFEKRVIKDPLSVLKLRLPPNRRCPKSAADPVSSPSELWTVNNPRGGTNRKNSVYSARNLFKLALTAFGDLTCGTPIPGNSYVSVAKKSSSAPSVQKNPDISTSHSKPSDSIARASPLITNLPIPSSPSVSPVSEESLATPDLTDFTMVKSKKKLKKDSPTKTNNTIAKAEKISKFCTTSHREVTNPIPTKDNISTHQSALKPLATPKPTSVDTELLPMAVLPPLEKILLQSRESNADAEMSSSSFSEEYALEYNMSDYLEDSPAVASPSPSAKPEKANKYKNR
ncbi:hypothetical protein AVEN_73113-1 [Araneus ventricosus]|uniref:Uncharacterized protein n=1 Tax=Araneus ventricosus TaxID=182803 RepID=A0A4Y2IZ49_ARAVE|nr:hypothetical protein AVEN_73113-1 [Araneus ventricosus]